MNDRDFLEYFEKLNKNPLPKPELFSIVSSLTNTLLISSHSQPTPIKPPTKPSIFGPGVPEDVEYSLKRAVKALCTTDFQLQARYSLVLQNFLRHFPVKTDKFMDFLLKECNVSNAIRKSETSHYVFASLLGFSALDQARKLDDEASFRVFLEKMLEIAEKYTSFRETVAQILENSLLSQENATKALKTRFRAISQRIKGEPFENSVFHINLLVSLQKAAKIAPKLEDFPLKSQLHANLLDYSRVLRLLLSSLEVFPRESCIIRSVIDFTDLYIRENHKTEEHWSGFFEYFSKELAQSGQTRAFDYKKAFLLLSLLYRYLKKPGFSAIALKNVAKEPLVSLWLRNLFVQNEVLRKISRKIERRVTQIFENAGNCLENREACVEFVEKMKKSLNYHFTGSCALAQAFFQHVIAEDQSFIESYWKILKKKLQKSESLQEKLYIVSEIVHFFERKQGNIKENLLLEGILSVFKEISREKIRKLLENEENFEALEENSMNFEKEAEKFEEKLYDSFYSLLGEVNKRPSSNFSKEKAAIWKGLSEKNEILLSLVLKECEKTQKNVVFLSFFIDFSMFFQEKSGIYRENRDIGRRCPEKYRENAESSRFFEKNAD